MASFVLSIAWIASSQAIEASIANSNAFKLNHFTYSYLTTSDLSSQLTAASVLFPDDVETQFQANTSYFVLESQTSHVSPYKDNAVHAFYQPQSDRESELNMYNNVAMLFFLFISISMLISVLLKPRFHSLTIVYLTFAHQVSQTAGVLTGLDPLVGNLDVSSGIGWIKAFECDVINKDFRYQSPFVDIASFVSFSNHAISVKLVPKNASNPADFEVQTVQCSNPVWNLYNGWEMSYTTDPTTQFITGQADPITDWIGTSTAKARLANVCIEDGAGAAIGTNPHPLNSGVIYEACGNVAGLHLAQHSNWKWCEWDIDNTTGGGIDFYLGFDPQLMTDCRTNAPSTSPTYAPSLPSQSPSDVPSNSPTQPSNSPSYAPSLSSMSPSNVPSNSPSDAPSQSTNSPSYAPSNYPSNSPSQPSSSPSNAPSQPSNTPSYAPSSHSNPPSISPSNAPSHPSSSPTVAPSQPSQAPSFTPSQPSTNPTVAPSFSPTLYDPEGEVPRTLFLSQNNGCDQGYCGSADPNLSCDHLTSTCQSFDYTWQCFNGYLGCDAVGYDGHGKIQMDIGTYAYSNPFHVQNKQIRIEGAGSQTVFEHNMAPTNAPSASPTNAPTTAPTTAPTSTVIPALDPLVGNLDISGGIGWIKAFECDVTRKSFRYQSPFVDLASFITFSNHAISAKLVPRNASNPADYEVQTVQCSNPIWNLNNGWEMSYTTDPTTQFITGYTDLNDWIGTSAAKERLNNSCVEDDVAIGANPHLLSSGLIYQACGKDEGLHLSQHSSWKWCEYGVGNANGGGIDFYLGFDPELARDCLITSAPSQSPSDFPTSAPSQPSNSPSYAPSQPSNQSIDNHLIACNFRQCFLTLSQLSYVPSEDVIISATNDGNLYFDTVSFTNDIQFIFSDANVTFTDCVFSQARLTWNITNNARVSFTGCTFTNLNATDHIFEVENADLSLSNCTFDKNRNLVSIIRSGEDATVSVIDSTFQNNTNNEYIWNAYLAVATLRNTNNDCGVNRCFSFIDSNLTIDSSSASSDTVLFGHNITSVDHFNTLFAIDLNPETVLDAVTFAHFGANNGSIIFSPCDRFDSELIPDPTYFNAISSLPNAMHLHECDSSSSCQNTTMDISDAEVSAVFCHDANACKDAVINAKNLLNFTLECGETDSCNGLTLNIIYTANVHVKCYGINACFGLRISSDSNHLTLSLNSFNQDVLVSVPADYTQNQLLCNNQESYLSVDYVSYNDNIEELSKDLFGGGMPCEDVTFRFDATDRVDCEVRYEFTAPSAAIQTQLSDFFSIEMKCYSDIYIRDMWTYDCFSTDHPTTDPTIAPTQTPDPTIAPTQTPDPTIAPSDVIIDQAETTESVANNAYNFNFCISKLFVYLLICILF